MCVPILSILFVFYHHLNNLDDILIIISEVSSDTVEQLTQIVCKKCFHFVPTDNKFTANYSFSQKISILVTSKLTDKDLGTGTVVLTLVCDFVTY